MKTFALFGDPVSHSLSPVFQNAAMKAAGVDARYVAVRVTAPEFPGALERIRSGEISGANVTIPWKRLALEQADRTTTEARRIGAVNWLALDADGRVLGDNTDAEGFARALEEAGVPVRGASAVVLGAGGAARAAAWALARGGAADVVVGGRRREESERLAGELALALGEEGAGEPTPRLEGTGMDEARSFSERAGIVVSAVPPGAWDAVAPARLARGAWICDLAYAAGGTPAERWAAAHGARALGGLPMLLHQGASSFEKWLGVAFPMEAARAALGDALGVG